MIEFLRDKLTGLGTRASSQAYAQVKSQDNYGLDCPQCGHRIVQEELDMQSTTPKVIPLRQAALWFTFLASLIALIGGFYYVGWQSALNQVQSNHLKSDIVFPDGEERRQFSNSRARGSSFTDGKLNTVPMKKVRWISDKRFMTTDPYTGRFWSNKEGEWTAWDEIHRGKRKPEDSERRDSRGSHSNTQNDVYRVLDPTHSIPRRRDNRRSSA
ncbi:unnamed protein product [Aspergillus oryzae]|nr:unnamed protein product [Aspergillus oryzae]GMF89424.1 unnamed protein product [Aspergillus oryzae]GMG08585.1 unnamed protein product [Aspergillus oryzae]